MKQNTASRRSAETARQKLASIMMFDIADPELDFVTITDVEVSVDRSVMKIYVSCEKDRYDEVMAAFGRAKGKIRYLLGQALDWRVVPELYFEIDHSTDEAEKISEALKVVPPTMAVEKDDEGYPEDK